MSNNTFRTLLVSASLLATLSSCEQADLESSSSYPAAVEEALDGIEFARAPGLSLDVLQHRVTAGMDAMYEVAGTAKTWQDAHVMAQEQIRSAEPEVVRSTVEQSMAKLMLVGYLVPNRGESDASELALDYAQSLVEEGSPEVEVVLETVNAFGSEWQPAERRAVSIGAAQAVEAHIQGGTVCPDCELPAEARRILVETGKTTDVMTLRRLDAARQLRALAG